MPIIHTFQRDYNEPDVFEHFPIEQVPLEIVSRSEVYSKKTGYLVNYVQIVPDRYYILQVIIPRKSEALPTFEVKEEMRKNEVLELCLDVMTEIYLQKDPLNHKAFFLTFRFEYNAAAISFIYNWRKS